MTLVLGLLLVQSVQAQFVVQPMVHEISTTPRNLIKTQLVLQNMYRDEEKFVQLIVVELAQSDSGTWNPIEPNDPMDDPIAIDLAGHQSCKDWIRLSAGPTELVKIPVMGSRQIMVDIDVPAGVSGFYSAAIIARLEARPDEGGVAMRYDFVVPILLTIEGGALPKRINLVDAGLQYVQGNGGVPDQTYVTLGIENTGATFGRVVGLAQLTQILQDNKTRLVKNDIVFPPVGIIPGSRLNLKEDIYQDLPQGTYQIKGTLFIDNRRYGSVNQTVEYAGSGLGGGVARPGTAIRMDPPLVEIETSPGRARSAVITIHNDADEPVTVKSLSMVPNVLASKVLPSGEKLDDLSCADWLTMRPEEFTLRGFSKRNVRLTVKMPDRLGLPQWDYDPGAYYANLRLFGFYGDDSVAGNVDASVCVEDKTVEASANVSKRGLKIESLGQSRFDVVAKFGNQSLIHIRPACMIAMYQLDGTTVGEQVFFERLQPSQIGSPIMLPFEDRAFGTELDLSHTPAGIYQVDATFLLGEGQEALPVVQSKPIEVFIRPDGVERAILFPQQ